MSKLCRVVVVLMGVIIGVMVTVPVNGYSLSEAESDAKEAELVIRCNFGGDNKACIVKEINDHMTEIIAGSCVVALLVAGCCAWCCYCCCKRRSGVVYRQKGPASQPLY